MTSEQEIIESNCDKLKVVLEENEDYCVICIVFGFDLLYQC